MRTSDDIAIVSPFLIGDGADFSSFKLFIEASVSARGLCENDVLISEAGNTILISEIELAEDFFNTFIVLTARMMSAVAGTTIDKKRLGNSLRRMYSAQAAPLVKDPTKIITITYK